MFYAGYILAVKGLRDRGETTLHLMAVTSTITALFLFPVALASGEQMLPAIGVRLVDADRPGARSRMPPARG